MANLADLRTNELAPITATTAPKAVTPINVPTLQDFISEAQKLGQQSIMAQKDILNANIGDVGEQLNRKLYGQNVGLQSGIGQNVIGKQIGEMSKRLEPIATQVGTDIAQRELQNRQEQSRQLYDLVNKGQITGDQASGILKGQGIDPNNYLTETQAKYKADQDELTNLKVNIKDPAIANVINSVEEYKYYIENGRTYEDEIADTIETAKTLPQWKAKLPTLQAALTDIEDQIVNGVNNFGGDINRAKAKAAQLTEIINLVKAGKVPIQDINTLKTY